MSVADLSVSRTGGLAVAANWGRRFGHWWLSGLRQSTPPQWLSWAEREALRHVNVQRDGETIVCRLAGPEPVEARFPSASFNIAVLETWLADQHVTREQVVVQAVVSHDLFFVRDMNVPKAALPALPSILDQELLHRTPFLPSDVWHAATVAGIDAGDVASIRHWIIRRDRAASALGQLGLTSDNVDGLSSASSVDADVAIPVIELQARQIDDPAWAVRTIRLLAVASVLAVGLALMAFEWSQASVAASVEAALAEARDGVQGGQNIDTAARLYAMRSELGVLETLDELSRILPDQTFLSEVRIENGKTIITGFSADAARLVRIIDKSPRFSGAALMAAITPDANEHRDRFTISFQARGARVSKSPARARSPS